MEAGVLHFGRRLAAIRSYRKLTQAQLGDTLGVSRGTVWHWEHDHYQFPAGRLQDVALALHCSPAHLLEPVEAPLPRATFRGGQKNPASAASPGA